MRLANFTKLVGLLSGISLFIVTGCASQGPVQAPETAQAEIPVDTSVPAAPVAVTAEMVVPPAEEKLADELPKTGSVASVLKKMDDNRFTLFWREKNTYTYHMGNVLDAEYKPGSGLVVKSETDSAVVCEFNEQGDLINVNAALDTQTKCNDLMFALDEDLDS